MFLEGESFGVHKVRWLFIHVVLLDNVTNWKDFSTKLLMVTRLVRVVTYNEELPLIKLHHDPWITWLFEVTWAAGDIDTPLSQCLCSPNLSGKVAFSEQLPPVNSHNPSKRWSCEFTWQIKYIIFPLAEDSSNTKLGTVLIYRERLPPLTKREVTWHFKNLKTLSFEKFKSPLSQDFWPLNLAECWLWGGDSTRKRLHCHLLLVYFLENLNFLIRVFL